MEPNDPAYNAIWTPPTPENLPEELATVVPPKPASGGIISSAWGIDVHDRIYTPIGAMCSGPTVFNVGATEVKLQLNALQYGNAEFFDDATDSIIIPPGAAGLYMYVGMFAYVNTASWIRVRAFKNGTQHIGGASGRGSGGTTHYTSFVYVAAAAEGDIIDYRASSDGADPADITVVRAGITRIGNNLSSSLP